MPRSRAILSLRLRSVHFEPSLRVTCASMQPSSIHTEASNTSGWLKRYISVTLVRLFPPRMSCNGVVMP